jgi:holo-[acyl-carrier protein] synthase
MIIGTGIDIIEVERVAEKISKENGFKERIFSSREITWCESKAEKAQHYAARFAAKEAFLKATGKGLTAGFNLADIELVNDALGKPGIVLRGSFSKLAEDNKWNKIHVSLSHVKSMACAFVIIEE